MDQVPEQPVLTGHSQTCAFPVIPVFSCGYSPLSGQEVPFMALLLCTGRTMSEPSFAQFNCFKNNYFKATTRKQLNFN
jgi:hypothetical protein